MFSIIKIKCWTSIIVVTILLLDINCAYSAAGKIDCGPLYDPQNDLDGTNKHINWPESLHLGFVSYPNHSTTAGSMAKFWCEKGYYVYGSEYAVCGKNGKWAINGDLFCQRMECTVSPKSINITHGKVHTFSGPPYKLNNIYWVTCDHGYKPNGIPVRQCLETDNDSKYKGTWSQKDDVGKILSGGDITPECIKDTNIVDNMCNSSSAQLNMCNSSSAQLNMCNSSSAQLIPESFYTNKIERGFLVFLCIYNGMGILGTISLVLFKYESCPCSRHYKFFIYAVLAFVNLILPCALQCKTFRENISSVSNGGLSVPYDTAKNRTDKSIDDDHKRIGAVVSPNTRYSRLTNMDHTSERESNNSATGKEELVKHTGEEKKTPEEQIGHTKVEQTTLEAQGGQLMDEQKRLEVEKKTSEAVFEQDNDDKKTFEVVVKQENDKKKTFECVVEHHKDEEKTFLTVGQQRNEIFETQDGEQKEENKTLQTLLYKERKEVRHLKEEKKAFQTQVEQLQQKVRTLEMDRQLLEEKQKFEKQAGKLQEEQKTFETKVQESREKNSERQKEENKVLTTLIGKMSAEAVQVKEEKEKKETRVGQLEEEKKMFETQIEQLQEEKKIFKTQVRQLQEENKKFDAHIAQESREVGQLKEKTDHLIKENESLRTTLAQQRSVVDKTVIQLHELILDHKLMLQKNDGNVAKIIRVGDLMAKISPAVKAITQDVIKRNGEEMQDTATELLENICLISGLVEGCDTSRNTAAEHNFDHLQNARVPTPPVPNNRLESRSYVVEESGQTHG